MFENNEDNTFNRLVMPADGVNEELNLTGKTLANLTSDETARMEQYSEYVRNHVVDPQGKKDIDKLEIDRDKIKTAANN